MTDPKSKLFEKYCRINEKPGIIRPFYESFDVSQRVAIAKRLLDDSLISEDTKKLLKMLLDCDCMPSPAEILAKSCEIQEEFHDIKQ